MLRVVLDANVFVSAILISGSKPARILDEAREGVLQILATREILLEVRGVLAYPKLRRRHRLTPKQIDEFLSNLLRVVSLTPGKEEIHAIRDDPEDNKYLACAMEGGADFIVSGDHHLTDVGAFRGVRIMSPASFLSEILGQDQAE